MSPPINLSLLMFTSYTVLFRIIIKVMLGFKKENIKFTNSVDFLSWF